VAGVLAVSWGELITVERGVLSIWVVVAAKSFITFGFNIGNKD